jgi:voltage-gated potassium channel
MDWERTIIKTIGLVCLIAAIGVLGLMGIEGWSFVDALYMTVITISTVGFGEVHALSSAGKILIIILIVFGVGAYIYIISVVAEYLVAGALIGGIGRRKMKKAIEKLDKHCIVCGFGRVGSEVAHEFKNGGVDFVVIEKSPERLKFCAANGYLYIEGDASNDDVLVEAGINRARGLITAVDSDAANVYVTLSAKSLNDDIFVVARSERADSEKKLRAAGADRVISPSGIGGRRLASQFLKPAVLEFLDVVLHSADIEIFMEEIKIRKGSTFTGLTLVEAREKCIQGANILAILNVEGGDMKLDLSTNKRIENNDMLIVVGTRVELRRVEELA